MRNPLHSIGKRLTRLRRFPVLVRRRGAVFLLDPRNWIDNRLAAGAPYENAQLERARTLIAEHRLDTFLDVGANIGLYTVMLGRLPEIERVIAVEPVRRNFNQMLGNVFANALDAKVEALRVAAGDAPGTATIHIDPRSTGLARFDTVQAGRDASVFSQSESVTIVRLDDTLDLKGRRIFLKLDVEGHALPALAGMARLFAGNVVVAQVEAFGDEAAAVTARMEALGLAPIGAIDSDHYFGPAS